MSGKHGHEAVINGWLLVRVSCSCGWVTRRCLRMANADGALALHILAEAEAGPG